MKELPGWPSTASEVQGFWDGHATRRRPLTGELLVPSPLASPPVTDDEDTTSDSGEKGTVTKPPTTTALPLRRSERLGQLSRQVPDESLPPRPNRLPTDGEAAQALHRNVEVTTQPGLGLGLQVTAGGIEEGEVVALMLATSVYALSLIHI